MGFHIEDSYLYLPAQDFQLSVCFAFLLLQLFDEICNEKLFKVFQGTSYCRFRAESQQSKPNYQSSFNKYAPIKVSYIWTYSTTLEVYIETTADPSVLMSPSWSRVQSFKAVSHSAGDSKVCHQGHTAETNPSNTVALE